MSAKIVNDKLYIQPTYTTYYQVPAVTTQKYNVITYPRQTLYTVPTVQTVRAVPTTIPVTTTKTTTIPARTYVKTSDNGKRSSTKYVPTKTIIETKPAVNYVQSLPVTYKTTYAPTTKSIVQYKYPAQTATKSIVIKTAAPQYQRTKSYVAYPVTRTKSIVAVPVTRTKSIVAYPVTRTTTIVQQAAPQPDCPQEPNPGYIQLSADQPTIEMPGSNNNNDTTEVKAEQPEQQEESKQAEEQEQAKPQEQAQEKAQENTKDSYPPIFYSSADQKDWYNDYLYKPNTNHNGQLVANLYVKK